VLVPRLKAWERASCEASALSRAKQNFAGQPEVNYSYDALNRLTTVTDVSVIPVCLLAFLKAQLPVFREIVDINRITVPKFPLQNFKR